jgi:hypothetical protein
MKKYESVSGGALGCSASDEGEGKKSSLPCSSITLPKGLGNVTMGEMVEITIRVRIKGFSEQDWNETDEVRLELHEASVKDLTGESQFADLVDE